MSREIRPGSELDADSDSPEATDPDGPQVHGHPERVFRRGNINFDFLQPEEKRRQVTPHASRDRRGTEREGKRGLFNRGRPQRPVGAATVLAWFVIGVACVAGVVGILLFGRSVIWLLVLPVAIAGSLWSVVMLALFKARPR